MYYQCDAHPYAIVCAGLLHWTIAWHTCSSCVLHVFVNCVAFSGLRSPSHSATVVCSVRVTSQAHPIMSYIHLVGIIMVGGHTENWSEQTMYSVQRNYRDLGNETTYIWSLGLRTQMSERRNCTCQHKYSWAWCDVEFMVTKCWEGKNVSCTVLNNNDSLR